MSARDRTSWLADSGAISCARHLPANAAQILDRRPNTQELHAEETWYRLGKADISSLRAMTSREPTCERCLIEQRQPPRSAQVERSRR